MKVGNFIKKETPAQVLSCKFWKKSNNSCFLRTAASAWLISPWHYQWQFWSKKCDKNSSIYSNSSFGTRHMRSLHCGPEKNILYRSETTNLKQQTNILRCFCSLKFEKGLFSNKFFSFLFRSKMTVHTAENDQIKYFAQN